MSNAVDLQTSETSFKYTASESESIDSLLDTLSDVEAFILALIVLCIVIVSIAIVWMSCKLCAIRDGSTYRRAKPSNSATSVYQWDSLTSQRE